MTLRHLKIFLRVCRELNMTRAAELLFMTQPSVSQAISELEEYYRVKLFERIARKIYITEDGYRLIAIAGGIVELFEKADAEIRDKTGRQKIRIGASVTIGTYILNDILKKVKATGDIDVEYVIDNTKNIEDMILTARLDAALVEGDIKSRDIIAEPFMDDRLTLACPAGSELAARKKVNMKELENYNFIIREQGSGTKELIEALARKNKVNLKIIGVASNIEAIKNNIIGGIGISILPEIAMTRELNDGKIAAVDLAGVNLKRKFRIARHKSKNVGGALKTFMECAVNFSKSFSAQAKCL
ncbi:MAG TPA: LysR family transcriptional regulator [Candidatus Wallbacteria bacterium]|nr:LysR family transcriptional regulator [Candidatus Wallbacteria bacterium]